MRRRLSSAQTSGERFDALEAHRLAGAFRERSASSPARCTEKYKRNGGTRGTPLPDHFIGAHAMVLGCRALTRDVCRFKMYFPLLKLIAPE